MSNVTSNISNAFLKGEARKINNSYTDGKSLYLFDNKIAEHRDDGMYITNCGWESKTTKERLNGLPDVRINQFKKKWYLNGEVWDGSRFVGEIPFQDTSNITELDNLILLDNNKKLNNE